MNNLILKIKKLLKYFWKDPLFLRYWEEEWYTHSNNDNQLSVRIVGLNKRHTYSYNGESSMFIEDMYSGIMPFMFYKGEKEKYPIKISPSSSEKERIISQALSGRDYRMLAESLCEFVRTTTHTLFQDGIAFYEIVYRRKESGEKESGEIESFSLEYLPPFNLVRIFNNYYQYVPWWDAKESHIKVQIIKIPKEKILKMEFPRQLGGKRKIKKILKRLWQLGKELIPKFQMDSMKENKDIGFNLNQFSKTKYLEIAKLTNSFGWNQRNFSDNYITEYYSIIRSLREKKVEASLRGEIISKLNEILNGSILKMGVKIETENIFTVTDVENQEKVLKKGNVTFMDIFNALKL